jgi:phage terminase large subunit-like protein
VSASIAQQWADLEPDGREELYGQWTEDEARAFLYDWPTWARPEQLPPSGDWHIWVVRAGRGFGKTRAGAEWVRALVESGQGRRIALVAPTAADARDVMVEGQSGLLSVCPPWDRPTYEPSKRRLTWPNGAIATTYSADEPERLRGPQHDFAWVDEIGSWRYPSAFDMLMFGLRLGSNPRCCITMTPRPTLLIKRLLKAPGTVETHGTTYDNAVNLAPTFLADIGRRYGGTRLGRQELAAELLEDVEGALWTYDLIERCRVGSLPAGVSLHRIVVAVDPSGGDDEGHDEQGIVVVGKGSDDNGYVLADRSCRLSPDGWGRRAVQAYLDHNADAILCEANFGGDMVTHTIKTAADAMAAEGQSTRSVPVRMVHASRGKRLRAEPIAALYEQGRLAHVGAFPELESQMAGWTPEQPSPDRLDAMVWGFSDFMLMPEVGQPAVAGHRTPIAAHIPGYTPPPMGGQKAGAGSAAGMPPMGGFGGFGARR